MKLSADLKGFANRIGHDFKRPELLIRALTHGSISSDTRPDNQRLEFLGDRVLGLVMAEAMLAATMDAVRASMNLFIAFPPIGSLPPGAGQTARDELGGSIRANTASGY